MHKDTIGSIALLFIALSICIGAVRYPMGNLRAPGPGLLPLALGMILGFLSLVILSKSIHEKGDVEKLLSITHGKVKVITIVIIVLVYGFLLERLGYVLTTILLFFMLNVAGIKRQKWYIAAGIGIVCSAVTYILFQVILRVELPRGLLEM